jgi:arylsulfatase
VLLALEARGVGLILAAVGLLFLGGWSLRWLRDWPRLGLFSVLPSLLLSAQIRGIPVQVPKKEPDYGPGTQRVLLLTMDTLRADIPLPSFQKLAARGRTGPTWATGPWTVPSVGSLLTGRSPYAHGAVILPPKAGKTRIGSLRVPGLARIFADAGWRSLAVVENPQISPERGFDDGFSIWDHAELRRPPRSLLLDPFRLGLDGRSLRPGARDPEARVDRALELLRSSDTNVFLWVHLLGPHLPYADGTTPLLDEALGPGGAARLNVGTLRSGQLRWTPALKAELFAAYREEAERADAALGRLIDAAGPDAIVLYTADHGEEFGEHGGWEHGHSLYEELLRVPMALAGPGILPGRWTTPASLIDVAPTLLALAGVAHPRLPYDALIHHRQEEPEFSGIDLRNEPPVRVLPLVNSLYGAEQEGLLLWPHKYTRRPEEGTAALVDLSLDPKEAIDLCPTQPLLCQDIYQKMDEEHQLLGEVPTGRMEEAVRALGYTE